MSSVHPLKQAYNQYVRETYGSRIRGDDNPERTEVVAQKVHRLGISYDEYVELACILYDGWARSQGWKYPYWNAVSSDNAIARIAELLKTNNGTDSEEDKRRDDLYELELRHAMNYVNWYVRSDRVKPTRYFVKDEEVIMRVAAHICSIYNINYISSNYNDVARQLVRITHG